jgi:micrococcal nuclease
MESFITALTSIFSLAFIGSVIWLIALIVKKQSKRIALVGIAVSFVAVGVLSAVSPPQENTVLSQNGETTSNEFVSVADADETISTGDEARDVDAQNENVGGETGDVPTVAPIIVPASAKSDENTGIGDAAAAAQAGELKTQTEASATYRVLRVVDGDTIEIEMNGTKEKVRFIGVDTPESVHPDASRNVEYGKIASDFTKARLDGSDVTLELDVQERDRYGRILAYVYFNGIMFNKTLLEEGHAQIATYPPNVKYVDDFTKLQESARNAKKGIWQHDSPLAETENAPPETATQQTDAQAPTQVADTTASLYVGNSNTMKFHRPTCRYVPEISLQNIVSISDRDAAVSGGYEPCKICNP